MARKFTSSAMVNAPVGCPLFARLNVWLFISHFNCVLIYIYIYIVNLQDFSSKIFYLLPSVCFYFCNIIHITRYYCRLFFLRLVLNEHIYNSWLGKGRRTPVQVLRGNHGLWRWVYADHQQHERRHTVCTEQRGVEWSQSAERHSVGLGYE